MKILVLSDLHINKNYYSSRFYLDKYKRILKNNIPVNYDLVLISGDVFESTAPAFINVFDALDYLFDGKTVVFCLGNHEFAYQSYPKVLQEYQKMKKEFAGSNVSCLDIDHYFDVDNTRIVGNAFWYDWSLNHSRLLMKGEIINGWLDASIEDFNPMKEHEVCKNNILNSIDKNKNHILLTHTVPHEELNLFSVEDPLSPYNAYSGCEDFLVQLKDKNFKFVFCGHTHRFVHKYIYDIPCLNLGNDYYFKTGKIDGMIFNVDQDLNINDLQFYR